MSEVKFKNLLRAAMGRPAWWDFPEGERPALQAWVAGPGQGGSTGGHGCRGGPADPGLPGEWVPLYVGAGVCM